MEQQTRSPSCLLLLVHRIHWIIIVLQVNSNYPIDTITFQHTLFLNTVGTSEKWHQHPTILQFKSKQEGSPGSRKPVVIDWIVAKRVGSGYPPNFMPSKPP